LLSRLFPDVDPLHPPDLGLAEFSGDSITLEGVGNFPSADIDHAVYNLLKQVAAMPLPDTSLDSDEDKFERWQYKLTRFELACRCVWRLTPPEGRETLLHSYQEMRLKYPEPKSDPKAVAAFDVHFNKFLQELLAKLAPK